MLPPRTYEPDGEDTAELLPVDMGDRAYNEPDAAPLAERVDTRGCCGKCRITHEGRELEKEGEK